MSDAPTDADLAALLDAERGAQAARNRSTERWLRQQALEEARLSGVLLTAAEQHAAVNLSTTSGRTYQGGVLLVGGDFVALGIADGQVVYVRLAAIAVLQPDRSLGAVPVADDRPSPRPVALRDALADQAAERPDVVFVCAGRPDAVPGRLLAVGVDVATVALAERRGVGYVALASVTEVLLRASG